MADRSITIRLGANVTGLQAGFRTAQRAVHDFGSQTQKFVENNRQSLEQVGQAGMIAGGVLAAGFGLAVTKFASFDKAMSSVQAATHETEANMELLREAAIRTGADTAFSAEEAARGIEEMAKAGVSTADILGGGLDGALALAAAGALDVGEAAELAATAMTQFGLVGEDIPHIADLLAAGAGKAQGSVQDMGAALKQAGLVANQTGLTIEETTGGLAAFASAGLVGSDAGTSFKSMLQRLTPQSKEAATKMAELGISAYDAQGNFVGLSEFAGILENSMKDLTVEERNAAMATIFGSDAVRAASVIYEQGADGVQKWEEAVNDAGYAAETAALMQDNLAGDLEKLGGAFDTVFLQSGSGANDALRSLVQTAEDFVDTLGKIPAPILSTIAVVTGLTGGALLLGGAFLTVVPRIADTVGAISDLRKNAPGAANAVGKLGKAAAIAGVAFVGFEVLKQVDSNMRPAMKAAEDFTQALIGLEDSASSIDDVFADLSFGNGDRLEGEITGIGDALDRLINQSFMDAGASFGATVMGMDNGMGRLADAVSQTDQAFTDAVGSGNMALAAEGFKSVADSAAEQGIKLDQVGERFPGYINSLKSLASEAGVALEPQELLNWALGEVPPKMEAAALASDGMSSGLAAIGAAATGATPITEAMAEALEDLGISADGAIVSLGTFAEALVAAGLMTLSARDAERSYEAAIDSLTASLAENGATMDINTEQGRANQAALDGIASAGLGAVGSMAAATDAFGNNIYTQDELQGRLRRTYDDLLTAAQGAGYTAAEADGLARSVLGIPGEANIDTWMSDFARAKADETMGRVNALDGKTANVYINTHDTTYKTTVLSTKDNRAPLSKGPQAFATGGAIYGPGTGTSDTAGLFRLSNGEHVLTAAEVKAMGGQSAVYGFRSQLRSGVPGYAGGGQVQGRQVPAMASASTMTASVDSSGVAAAVASAMSGWQPIVSIGGREFAGVMQRGGQYGNALGGK